MRIELRKSRNGYQYYSFIYYDIALKKRVRLSREQIQDRFGKDLTTKEDAEDACKLLSAEIDSLKQRLDKRKKWEGEFYNYNALLASYSEWQKKRAPNSYENSIHYLKVYVLHYFLNLKKCNNLASWPDYYEQFRDWLENDARLLKKQEEALAYASKNHCIRALNTLMRFLYNQRVISQLIVCEKFPSYKLKQRTIEDVVSEEEMEIVFLNLKQNGFDKESVFFRLLFFSGMRFNEALGLSIDNIFVGQVQHCSLTKRLLDHRIEYFGYIVIDSQPSHRTRGTRDSQGRIARKPLKGRKKIDNKSARTIVISDQILWNALVQLYNKEVEKFELKVWGNDLKDYALFDGLDKSTATVRLKTAYELSGFRYRSWHCLRHTCATNLIGRTGDNILARLWLGHSSEAMLEKYNHIYEAINRTAKKFGAQQGVQLKKIELPQHA